VWWWKQFCDGTYVCVCEVKGGKTVVSVWLTQYFYTCRMLSVRDRGEHSFDWFKLVAVYLKKDGCILCKRFSSPHFYETCTSSFSSALRFSCRFWWPNDTMRESPLYTTCISTWFARPQTFCSLLWEEMSFFLAGPDAPSEIASHKTCRIQRS
jgi:hypothetical protein